jgi:putative long chain acyl-CoA synthase
MDIGRTLTAPVQRAGALAQNALEVARFGGLETGESASPFEVIARDPVHRTRRYLGGNDGPPVLLVPPMMLAAEVWDVSPTSSAVAALHGAGVDTYVVDFGSPEHEEGGLERDLADHVVAVSAAVDEVRELTGRDVHLGGYSQGGMFCYQTAAFRRNKGLASLITFGSPVDTRGAVPFGIPEQMVGRGAGALAGAFGRQALPAWASRLGFRLMDPVKAARQQMQFVLALHDREALLPRERQRRFLQADGWVAWPGPALADFMRQFVVHNRMMLGGFTIEDRLVTLADIKVPVLTFVGTIDEIAPPAAVRPIVNAAPDAKIYERAMRAGHFGLVVGSQANSVTWPTVAAWAKFVDGEGKLPSEVERVTELKENTQLEPVGARAGYGLGLGLEVGAGIAKSFVGGATRAVGALRDFGGEAATQVPRLARLERVRPNTRISLGRLLDEQAERTPDGVLFLFEDRAHTRTAAKHRIDSVVRGLLSLGVRQGEHVGVLMEARPSALVTTAALNRLGAVTVLLRPGSNVALEAQLGQIARVITEPESIDEALQTGVQVLVLGGGAADRDLGPHVIDMERIDPDDVTVPRWYSPNPGRARDLAFVLFTGEGDRIRVNRITNRRWALSAFGTASAAALTDGDTVYSVAPPYHPSALLMSLGGAVAGGSRIAMARRFDPSTFWEEVRRYGVTISSYTWTMLRELANAPEQAGERHHPVRLFIGSGMPGGLWERVSERFAPAQVLEMYASTQGEAILINVTAAKPGAMGRPLPGSAEVRIADWDIETGQLKTVSDGFARRVRRGQAGMLLSRDDHEMGLSDVALRGVFERDDAWIPTGDLFMRDADGDYWLVDPVGALVRTAEGRVPIGPARAELAHIDGVDLAVCYGIPVEGGDEVVVGTVTLQRGVRELKPAALTRAVLALPEPQRPRIVHVVPEIPVTTWYRPQVGELRKRGIPKAGKKAFAWDAKRERYKVLTDAARTRLIKTGSLEVHR